MFLMKEIDVGKSGGGSYSLILSLFKFEASLRNKQPLMTTETYTGNHKNIQKRPTSIPIQVSVVHSHPRNVLQTPSKVDQIPKVPSPNHSLFVPGQNICRIYAVVKTVYLWFYLSFVY